MRKFVFKLQKLFDIREAKEKEVQNELARVVGLQNIERLKQQELTRHIEEERKSLQGKMTKGVHSVNDILSYEKFVDVSLRAIHSAEDRIKKLEPEVQKVRELLVIASREKRVVEKLKEKQFEEYTMDLNREMAKENDDINQNMFNRKKMYGHM